MPTPDPARGGEGADCFTPRARSEWTEADGDVLWWRFPIVEPPYVGSPLDIGRTVRVTLFDGIDEAVMNAQVGGWPDYHTHWTPIPRVMEPRG